MADLIVAEAATGRLRWRTMDDGDARLRHRDAVPPISRFLQRERLFGEAAIVAFLIVQVLDGTLTYLGILTFGRGIEGNPLLIWLMEHVGEGTALTSAKVLAGALGIALHLRAVDTIVALLTAVYIAAAIVPWTSLLFF